MTDHGPELVLGGGELLWVFEQCGVRDWPYPLAPAAWPADSIEETVLARARTEDGLRARGLLAPRPAATLLAIGTAVAQARCQVDLVRRSRDSPCAAVAVAGPGGGALLVAGDHGAVPVRVRPLPDEDLVGVILGLLPTMSAAPGPALEVPPSAGDPATPETRRRGTERRTVEVVLGSATAWSHVGVAVAPNEVSSSWDRAESCTAWVDGPRGRYRLRHDPGAGLPAGRGTRPGPAHLVPDDAASSDVRAALHAALGPSGRSTA